MRPALLLALVALCSRPLTCQAVPSALVNGDFEEGLAGYEGHAGATVVVQAPHSGAHCLRLDGVPDANSFVQQSVTVEAGREYDLSVWSRPLAVPEGADCKAYLNAWAGDRLLASMAPLPRISGTHPWTQQSVRVRMPEGADRASILLQLYKSTGTVWFDGLVFAPVIPAAERARLAGEAAGQKQAVAHVEDPPDAGNGPPGILDRRIALEDGLDQV